VAEPASVADYTVSHQRFEHHGVSGNHNDRIDIFVLLDLIGARNMEFSKLERSTGGNAVVTTHY
jgi:hypothetical protein